MTHRLLCVLALLCGAVNASSAAPASEKVDRLIEREMKRYGIVGATVAVRVGDEVAHRKAYGLASLEHHVPTTLTSIYQLSSTTKIFTGTALIKVLTAKKIPLDTPARTLLPELPEAWAGVTVGHLASHLSGLPDVVEMKVTSAEDAIEKLGAKPVEAKPGLRWKYNQTNFMLVRRIIERLSGQTFEDYLAKEIFAPAGMTSTLHTESMLDVVPNRATGYETKDGVLKLREFRFSRYNNGAAGLNSTVDDMLRFDAALRGGKILTAEALESMWRPAKLSDGSDAHYGIGWDLNNTVGHRSAGHEGGGMTTMRRFIDDDATVVLLTNGARERWDVEDLVERIVAVWKPEARLSSYRLTDEMLEHIEAGHFAEARTAYEAFRRAPANANVRPERALNKLGYQLLRRRMLDDAVAVFALNAETNPDSANAHDSLGEAYLAKGDRAAARKAYERVLQLDPAFESAKKALAALTESPR